MHFDFFTKAYIRGPIGLSIDAPNQANFPPDPSGTVTERHLLRLIVNTTIVTPGHEEN